MKKGEVDIYKTWATAKANEYLTTFGSKKLALKVVDEILDVLTNLDGRCESWNRVKFYINEYKPITNE